MSLLITLKKDRFVLSVLVCSLLLGVLVRTVNLPGSRFLNPDEYFSIFFNAKSFLLYLAYSLSLLIFNSYFIYDVVLFTTAFWGVMSILLVYLIGKASFNDKIGVYASLILSVFGYHVYYSRTGYASIQQSFLLLLGYYLFVLSAKGDRSPFKNRYLFVSGLMFGLSFLTYPVSYAPIAAFGIMAFVVFRLEKIDLKEALTKLAVLGGGGLITIISMEIICRIRLFGFLPESFFSFLLVYRQGTASYAPKSWLTALWFFREIYNQGGLLQTGLVMVASGYCMYRCILKKDHYLLLLAGFILLGYFIFSLTALMGAHSIYPRKYLFLVPFVCICCGYFLYEMEKKTDFNWIIPFLVIFVGISLISCTEIINKAFKISPITNWLKQHKIEKNQIITRLDLYENGDPQSIGNKLTETGFLKNPAKSDYRIDWNKVVQLYHEKKMRYLLTSGIGKDAKIGFYDKILKKTEPLKTWSHPYHKQKPWLFDIQDFALYDLNFL